MDALRLENLLQKPILLILYSCRPLLCQYRECPFSTQVSQDPTSFVKPVQGVMPANADHPFAKVRLLSVAEAPTFLMIRVKVEEKAKASHCLLL